MTDGQACEQTIFELTPNAQLWPRSLNEDIGGSADGIYLIVGDLGSNSGEGLDFISEIPHSRGR